MLVQIGSIYLSKFNVYLRKVWIQVEDYHDLLMEFTY